MLDAGRLAVLVEIAHAGSIAGAAQRLSFTPSAVSQQLAKLERDLGCQLVQRHPRGVRLTPIGRMLVTHAETVVGELRTAEQSVRAMLGEAPAPLALGTFASAGQSLVPEALAGFRRNHPSVALRLLDLEPPDGYGLVSSGPRCSGTLAAPVWPSGTCTGRGQPATSISCTTNGPPRWWPR
jgi:DNA-binding transcriptional LysR family regulator